MACTDHDEFDSFMKPLMLYSLCLLHLLLGLSTVGKDLYQDLFCQSLHLDKI